MPLFLVTPGSRTLRPIAPQSLSESGLSECDWVHGWLQENFQLFLGASDCVLIGKEVNVTGSGPEGFLDFLAIDLSTGNTVIVEAKRDDFDSRRLVGQVVEYAAGVSGLSTDRLGEIYRELNRAPGEASLEGELSQKGVDAKLVNKHQSIILVVQDSPKNQGSMLRLKSACVYLREKGLDINILQLRWYKKDASAKEPQEGDIVEAAFVWDVDTGASPPARAPLRESAFLLDKTDVAIVLYRAVIDLLDTEGFRYSRRTTSSHITFYGRSRAFLVIQFEDTQLKARLRLGEGHTSGAITRRLSRDHDKLAASDGFLYEVVICTPEDVNRARDVLRDSYRYNDS